MAVIFQVAKEMLEEKTCRRGEAIQAELSRSQFFRQFLNHHIEKY